MKRNQRHNFAIAAALCALNCFVLPKFKVIYNFWFLCFNLPPYCGCLRISALCVESGVICQWLRWFSFYNLICIVGSGIGSGYLPSVWSPVPVSLRQVSVAHRGLLANRGPAGVRNKRSRSCRQQIDWHNIRGQQGQAALRNDKTTISNAYTAHREQFGTFCDTF